MLWMFVQKFRCLTVSWPVGWVWCWWSLRALFCCSVYVVKKSNHHQKSSIYNSETSLFCSIYIYKSSLSSAAFLPQAGEASVQPDASDCSCEGSHKEQQSLVRALCPHPRLEPCLGCVRFMGGRGLGVWVVGDVTAQGWGVLCDLPWQHEDKRPPGLRRRTDIWPCSSRAQRCWKDLASLFTSPALCTCRAVHHKCVCVCVSECVCVCVCVCVWVPIVHICLCHMSCLAALAPETKIIRWKNPKEQARFQEVTSGAETMKMTQPKSPCYLRCPAVGLVFLPSMEHNQATLAPFSDHLMWESDSGPDLCLHDYGSVEKHCSSSADCNISRWHICVYVCVSVCRGAATGE